ncbi:hypothetical protein, partial [Bacillus subtilis]|uniref:hypothetical protein n=1 Tax=Bacillus subtilis TaxID=1423 RepID=UPI002DB80FF9
FLHLKPDEYLKKLYKTKKLVEKTSFSLQAELAEKSASFFSRNVFYQQGAALFAYWRNGVL